jgi:hypothetical protein
MGNSVYLLLSIYAMMLDRCDQALALIREPGGACSRKSFTLYKHGVLLPQVGCQTAQISGNISEASAAVAHIQITNRTCVQPATASGGPPAHRNTSMPAQAAPAFGLAAPALKGLPAPELCIGCIGADMRRLVTAAEAARFLQTAIGEGTLYTGACTGPSGEQCTVSHIVHATGCLTAAAA